MFEKKAGKGAKFFRGHEPVKVVYRAELNNRSEASVREAEIKKMSLSNKRRLIENL